MHEYFGFTPSFSHAVFRGVPSGMSIFFPFDVNTVMRRGEELLDKLLRAWSFDGWRKACADPRSAVNKRADINENLDILVVLG